MKVTEVRTKESTKHCCGNGCPQKDTAEQEEYEEALTEQRMTENNLNSTSREERRLLEEIISPENLNRAYRKVKRNRGAGGIDGMKVEELYGYLRENREELRESILAGKYKPSPVRRVEIPKENGKKRMLGIPTAADRVIQQAIAQVISPIYEGKFLETSYGFRPGKSAHEALKTCRMLMNAGYVWAVELDLEKFFDTVNQSKMIQLLGEEVKDGRVISLIHKYLRAGAVQGRKYEETKEGVPQGGPLSPLLGNIMLHELDKELTRRGHWFVRYADDIVILCRSKAGAEQTMEHIIPYIEKKLYLKVNREKSKVSHANRIKFLGYGFYKDSKGYQLRVHKKSIAKMKEKVRELTDRKRIRSYEKQKEELRSYITGWVNYFKLAEMKNVLKETDQWMRRRIRMNIWKKWKTGKTRYRNLVKLGLNHDEAKKIAGSRKGCWRISDSPNLHAVLSNRRLEQAGYLFFSSHYKSVKV